jgi:hypothetical protein
MLKTCSTVAALALIALLGAPAGAQSPPSWTQAGMLRCVVNPSIFHAERTDPAAGLSGRSQYDWAQHRHLSGRCVRLGRVGANGWHQLGIEGNAKLCRAPLRFLESNTPLFKPSSHCANCVQLTGKEGDEWRPCNIFPGKLVNANGWCKVWAPKPGAT